MGVLQRVPKLNGALTSLKRSKAPLWIGALVGVGLSLWSLRWQIMPTAKALLDMALGRESDDAEWAYDRAASAFYEAGREAKDPDVARQYTDLSSLAKRGTLYPQGSNAADILIATAGAINSNVAPIAVARLRFYMGQRGISWKSGGSEVTDAELQELQQGLGLKAWIPPILHPRSLIAGLVLTGVTVALLTRNGVRKARKNKADKAAAGKRRQKAARQALEGFRKRLNARTKRSRSGAPARAKARKARKNWKPKSRTRSDWAWAQEASPARLEEIVLVASTL